MVTNRFHTREVFIQSLHHTKNRCAALKQSINSFKPFVRTVFSRYLDCQMREPAVRGCTMPVLHACRNVDAVTGVHWGGVFPPFLIKPSPCDTNQNLAAPFVCVMDMPVIAASGFKSDIEYADLLRRNRSQITLTAEILGISVIWLSDWKNHAVFMLFFPVLSRGGFIPNFFCYAERRPCF